MHDANESIGFVIGRRRRTIGVLAGVASCLGGIVGCGSAGPARLEQPRFDTAKVIAGIDAALVADLRDRGLLDDTLVIWRGEFGRTPVAEAKGEKWGRDHHPFGFTAWVAGGGFAKGRVVGQTDEYGWHAIDKPVHVHDLHATALHLLGIDHMRFTHRFQGRDFRLTDVAGNNIVPDLMG